MWEIETQKVKINCIEINKGVDKNFYIILKMLILPWYKITYVYLMMNVKI